MTPEIDIRQFISLVLERDAYERKTGEKFTHVPKIREFASDDRPPKYYFTMTGIIYLGLKSNIDACFEYTRLWGTWNKLAHAKPNLSIQPVANVINQFLNENPKISIKNMLPLIAIPGIDIKYFEKFIDAISKKNYVKFFQALAQKTNLSDETVQKLLGVHDDRVNAYLAKNTAYPGVLEQLINSDANEKIRKTAAKTLEKLRKSKEKLIKSKK